MGGAILQMLLAEYFSGDDYVNNISKKKKKIEARKYLVWLPRDNIGKAY